MKKQLISLSPSGSGGGGGTKYQHNIQFRFSVNPTWMDGSSQVVDTTALITFIDDDSTKITKSNILSRVFQKMGLGNANRYPLISRDIFKTNNQGDTLEKIIYCSSAFYISFCDSIRVYIGVDSLKLWKYDVANNTYTKGGSGMSSSLTSTIINVNDLVLEI